jgi:TusA-related sulfurtransferase
VKKQGDRSAAMRQAQAHVTVDIRGLIAPITLLKVEEILAGMVPGQVMDVLGDDEETRVDLISIVNNSGHELISINDQKENFRLLIRKGTPDGQ